ncbi:MAG: PD-(D/E)XK nuclease family protein [Bacteroidales bacterium]
MITPRRTRLVRVPDLHAFQRAIAHTACAADLAGARACAVLVPTTSAAAQLRHTLENQLLLDARPSPGAVAWPDLLTRDEWYERMHRARAGGPRMLSAIEREVLLGRAARSAVSQGFAPPFRVRPALVAEMLAFLDTMLRLGRTLDAFERLFTTELETQAPIDRGADRLLRQTHFLVAAFREYRALVQASGCLDEHTLRERLLSDDTAPLYTRIVVTVGDRSSENHGLWPVDFDLLARLRDVQEIDVIATEQVLAAGFHERLQAVLPGFDEWAFGHPAALSGRVPLLAVPAGLDQAWWVSRDREEEVTSVSLALKSRPAPPALDRVAVVCKRPLPYVYLAQSHLAAAGVPFQAFDQLPLAAEPFAAAVDLVFRAVDADLSPRSLAAVLGSPHFTFELDGRRVDREDVAAFERALRETSGVGSLEALERVVAEWSTPGAPSSGRLALRAARAAVALGHDLEGLCHRQPASEQCATLAAWLDAHTRAPANDSPLALRAARARAAIVGALGQLRSAHARHDDSPADFAEFVARVRRWMEAQTFAPRTGTSGVHLVDADAARYGDFDEAYLVGLIDREWPDSAARPIFYPMSLLGQLGWPPERPRLAAARAAFGDLVRLPGVRVAVSTFVLEDDTLVEPSPFLDDLSRSGLAIAAIELPRNARVLPDDAVASDPLRADVLPPAAREWALLRRRRSPQLRPEFHGQVGATSLATAAVRRLESYLDCPFKYFAESVLRLTDESDDDPGEGPRADGQFLHEVLAAFYEKWQAGGGREIAARNIDSARAMFAGVVEERLEGRRGADAALWQARLLGCAARTGMADVVLRAEAAAPLPVVERLLEYRLDGPCVLTAAHSSRQVTMRGIADRVDLLEGGRFRVIDYKLGRAPDTKRAIQLPIYAVQVQQQVSKTEGRALVPVDAAYLAFGERTPYVRLAARPDGLARAISDGQARLLDAVEQIERGVFPPAPADFGLCSYCAFARVCRKDYVDGP